MMVTETQNTDRKLAFLKRSGLFNGDTKGATIERAFTLKDLESAYALVHRVYVEAGFVSPDPSALRLRLYETTSDTATFVAKKDNDVIGVLSVVPDSNDLGLPSNKSFKNEIDTLRTKGKVCELTNQVVAEQYRKSGVTIELMRCAIAHMIKSNYDFAIAAVSGHHKGFYELIAFTEVGSERSYSDVVYDPVILLSLNIAHYKAPSTNLNEAEKYIHYLATDDNPYTEHITAWKHRSITGFLNVDLLEHLFGANSNFLNKCTVEEISILRRRWGEELFNAVTQKN